MKKSVLAVLIIIIAILSISFYDVATEPVNLGISVIPTAKDNYDPLGENVSFAISSPGTRSTYFAWIKGPNNRVANGIDYSIVVSIIKTGQNLSGIFDGSALSVVNAVYVPASGENITIHQFDKVNSNGTSIIIVQFNALVMQNNVTYGMVKISLVGESTFGPYHIPGQKKTISLKVKFP